MAGITAILSRDPFHPVHQLVKHAIHRSSFCPTSCQEDHYYSKHGYTSVHRIIPGHLFYKSIAEKNLTQTESNRNKNVWMSYGSLSIILNEKYPEIRFQTDRFNRYPVFVFTNDDFIVITTELAPLFQSGIIPFEWDSQGVASFLQWEFEPFPRTLFQRINLCLPDTKYKITSDLKMHSLQQSHDKKLLETKLNDVIEAYAESVTHSYNNANNPLVALSGGWDSRATLAVFLEKGIQPHTLTFGAPDSIDVSIAKNICSDLKLIHTLIFLDEQFNNNLFEHLSVLLRASNGMAPLYAAHEMYVNGIISRKFDLVIDSAGCEFRRGYRILKSLRGAQNNRDVVSLFLKTYSTGLWNQSCLTNEFIDQGREAENGIYGSASESSFFSEILDSCFARFIWNGHYAHAYNAQTHFIRCGMPMYDETFHSMYTALPSHIRWSKKFQYEIIKRFYPKLFRYPISHGGIRIPAHTTIISALPALLRHESISWLRNHTKIDLSKYDNSHTHLPYQSWLSANNSMERIERGIDFISQHTEWFNTNALAYLSNYHFLFAIEYLAMIEQSFKSSIPLMAQEFKFEHPVERELAVT